MKEIDKIFFGNNGLTSTSANYIANKAKEYIAELEIKFNKIGFVDEKLLVPGTNDTKYVRKGYTFKDLKEVVDNDIKKMYQIKSLIAWLREGIKCKDNYITNLNYQYTFDEYLKENNIEETVPVQKPRLTDEDVIRTWDIETRKKYYDLETKCAVLGKMIHKDSPLSKGKEEMVEIANAPSRIEKFDNSILIYERESSMKLSDLNDTIFQLQNEHRAFQAELNNLKFKIQETITNEANKSFKEYQEEYQKYQLERNKNFKAYQDKLLQIKDEIGNLKIVIPQSLKETYDFVNKL